MLIHGTISSEASETRLPVISVSGVLYPVYAPKDSIKKLKSGTKVCCEIVHDDNIDEHFFKLITIY